MKSMLFFTKRILISSWLLATLCSSFACSNKTYSPSPNGKTMRLDTFNSKYIGKRVVDIWMPTITDDTVIAFQVIYMHDGQMLFDSTQTWNHLEWHADESLQKLHDEGKIPPTMIVAIHNGGNRRHSEFFPKKVFDNMNDSVLNWCAENGRNDAVGGSDFDPLSDAYLRFIVEELKPMIDTQYFVKKDVEHTFIAGSSMGGLISMYAICEYPQIFGGAMCFSTHWPGVWKTKENPIPDLVLDYMNENLPKPRNHRLYFDLGDQTLDALYPPIQAKVDALLHAKGFQEKNWITRFFAGDDHSEKSWSRRFPNAVWWMCGAN